MNFLKHFITHSLIFLQFYGILYITWWKITRELLHHNLLLDWYLSSDYFRRSKASGKNQLKWFTFSSLWLYVEEKQTCFVDSSHRDVKKMILNAALERKKRQQNLLSLHNAKINGRVQSIKTLFWPAGMSADNVLTWEIVLKISHFTLEVLLLLQTFNSWTISKWLLLSVDIPVAKGVYDCLWLNKGFGVTFLFASVFGSFPKSVRHTADKWWNLARLIFLICIFALLPWI